MSRGIPVRIIGPDGSEGDYFGGAVYANQDIATVDTARRFETSSKKLRDAYITVATKAQLFGDSVTQPYPVAIGGVIHIKKIDISTLYFKNSVGGEDGTVNILAVEE